MGLLGQDTDLDLEALLLRTTSVHAREATLQLHRQLLADFDSEELELVEGDRVADRGALTPAMARFPRVGMDEDKGDLLTRFPFLQLDSSQTTRCPSKPSPAFAFTSTVSNSSSPPSTRLQDVSSSRPSARSPRIGKRDYVVRPTRWIGIESLPERHSCECALRYVLLSLFWLRNLPPRPPMTNA